MTELVEADLGWQEVYPMVVRLMRLGAPVNLLYIVREYLLLAAALAGGGWVYDTWQAGQLPAAGFVALAAVLVVVIGALQHRLSALGHEASHFSLLKNKLANDLVSDVLLMFPTFAITQQFRATHLDHHRFINDPEKDPDVRRLGNALPGRFPMAPRGFLLRYVVGSLWLPASSATSASRASTAGRSPGGPSD